MISREIIQRLLDNPEAIHTMADPERILEKLSFRIKKRMVKHQPALVNRYESLRDEEFLHKMCKTEWIASYIVSYIPSRMLKIPISKHPNLISYVEPEEVTSDLARVAAEAAATVGLNLYRDADSKWVYTLSPEAGIVLAQANPEGLRRFAERSNTASRIRTHGEFPEYLIAAWEEATGSEWEALPTPVAPVFQAGQYVPQKPEPPGEHEKLPSKDVKKGSFLKRGYSVRGARGDRFGRIPGRLLNTGQGDLGFSRTLARLGEPFKLSIASLEPDLVGEVQQLPQEMYELMDLHGVGRRADLKRFIGWIGGTITDDAMWVHETQSDLMQRTWTFQNAEAWQKKQAETVQATREDLINTRQELRALKQRYSNLPASERFRAIERIAELEKEFGAAQSKASSRPGFHEQYAEYRSKIENLHSKWIEAFYHVAIWYAKYLKKDTLYIATSKEVAGAWGRDAGDESTIYTRAYDGIAQKLGAELITPGSSDEGEKGPRKAKQTQWWKLDISRFVPKEDIARIATLISEDIGLQLESMDVNGLRRALADAGYSNINVVKAPEDESTEFQRIDVMAGTNNNEGQAFQVGDPQFDVTDDRIDRIISTIGHGELRQMTPDEAEGIGELEEDASLMITAAKLIDGRWVGVSIVCLDDPRFQFNTSTYHVDDSADESDMDTMSQEELENWFSAPSWGEDSESP